MINAGEGRGVCSATWNGHDEHGNRYEQELGCLNNLPLDAFKNQRSSTICDMCLYKKGLDLERLIPRLEYLFTIYPKNRWNQRHYEEKALNTAKYWNEWTVATVRIMERGEKPTARSIAAEAGVSVGVIYKYFKRKPVKLFVRLAEKQMEASRG